jgi:hypothetical protein
MKSKLSLEARIALVEKGVEEGSIDRYEARTVIRHMQVWAQPATESNKEGEWV